jgi:hypothetical protein
MIFFGLHRWPLETLDVALASLASRDFGLLRLLP